MPTRLVGIGEMAVSSDPSDCIKTIGLGSCVAIVVTDPARRLAGMAHIVLPKKAPGETAERPVAYYADEGVKLLVEEMKKLGTRPGMGAIVKIIGGAATGSAHQTFTVGKRNVLAVKKSLFRHGMAPVAEDIGGKIPRTVSVNVADGKTTVTSPQRPEIQL